MRYCNNHSTMESVSKLRRGAMGSLEIGESVTIKTKSRLWKAVIVNLQPEATSTKKRKFRHVPPSSICQTPFPLPTWHHYTFTSHWTTTHLTYSPIHDQSSHKPSTSLLRHTPSTSQLRHTPSTSSMTRPSFSTNITLPRHA